VLHRCHPQVEQAKLAASPIEKIVNGASSNSEKELVAVSNVDLQVKPVETKAISFTLVASPSGLGESQDAKPKQGPNRCTAYKKRVGLTGFNCRCGNLFCFIHCYSDKHECPFDYCTAGSDVIAKANPIVKDHECP